MGYKIDFHPSSNGNKHLACYEFQVYTGIMLASTTETLRVPDGGPRLVLSVSRGELRYVDGIITPRSEGLIIGQQDELQVTALRLTVWTLFPRLY